MLPHIRDSVGSEWRANFCKCKRLNEMFIFPGILRNSVLRHNFWLQILVLIGVLSFFSSILYLPDLETQIIVNGSLNILNRVRDSGYFTEGSALWVSMTIGGLAWLILKYREKKKNSQPHAGVVITDTALDD